MDPSTSRTRIEDVVIHPLVLLSVADHYHRVAKHHSNKRVVGVLLGSMLPGGVADVSNSYAVPFEEKQNNPEVWFLDHNFLDTMYWMFKKVNTREQILGFYSTGPKIRENDLKISNLFLKFCACEPVFAIIDIRPDIEGIPITAYIARDDIDESGSKEIQRTFKHIPCRIEAEEAEEVGVEHLLRDINDPSTSTLAKQITNKLKGLSGLASRLRAVEEYLQHVEAGRLPPNHSILYNLQDVFNLLPNLNVQELLEALMTKTNDIHHAIYISSLVRSVIALHNLLNNFIKFRDVDEVLDRKANVEGNNKTSKPEAKSPTTPSAMDTGK
jgi:26S proteasome regulatory subunit N8